MFPIFTPFPLSTLQIAALCSPLFAHRTHTSLVRHCSKLKPQYLILRSLIVIGSIFFAYFDSILNLIWSCACIMTIVDDWTAAKFKCLKGKLKYHVSIYIILSAKFIMLFLSITMFCGIDNIPQHISWYFPHLNKEYSTPYVAL